MFDAIFQQADLNKDQRLDINEFRNLIIQNLNPRSHNGIATNIDRVPYATSSYESGLSGYSGLINSTQAGTGGGAASQSSYEQSSYRSITGAEATGIDTSIASSFGVSGLDGNISPSPGLNSETIGLSSSSVEMDRSQQQQQLQVDPTNPHKLFFDPNPQIIRRSAVGGVQTYTQNVRIRFLQPPPLPPPGPLIIKEVRPPQPPPLPPLRIRQQAPAPSQPLPLVLRERPPNPPASVAAQTVIRRLAALPMPPRSVIIERLPPLPPKPRDIIIERWIPYGTQPKRKTIVQRAAAAKGYPKPRNIIIIYEPIQVRVIRQFQRLGIFQENPQLYMQRFGATLLDPQTLVQQARAAGVIEDIAPPTNITASIGFTNATYGINTSGSYVNASASPFETSNYRSNQQTRTGLSDVESIQKGISFNNDGVLSSYRSNSVTSQGTAVSASNGTNTSGYESNNTFMSGFNNTTVDLINAAFSAADLNKDGRIDPEEFRQFLNSYFRAQQ